MLQVFCLAFAALLITLVVAYFNKPHQYGILWGGALVLMIGTMLLLGLGVVDLFDDGHPKPPTIFAVVLSIVISCGMAMAAESLKHKQKAKADSENKQSSKEESDSPTIDKDSDTVNPPLPLIDNPKPDLAQEEEQESAADGQIGEDIAEDVDFVEVSDADTPTLEFADKLKTDLALKVFDRAINAGLITPMPDRYQWNLSTVLLSYMCGKIYSGDHADYDKAGQEYIWIKGDAGVFPEKALNDLFKLKNIGQLRRNYSFKPISKRCVEIDELFN